ncbi:MAG: endonuclease III [Desulfobacterales bacterium]|jgi:endonuclease-3
MHPLRRKTDKIRKILRDGYPDVKTALTHRNAFELLVATILSAQTTDRQVNRVTGALFEKYPTAADLAAGTIEEIEDLIRPTGFFHNKARNIKACAQALVKDGDGQVPRDLEVLTRLPGVGRKTANVVLGAAFGIPGMVVDTHVKRIAGRLGLTLHSDPVKIEYDLMAIVPRRAWNAFGLQLIHFGRDVCHARRPACPNCPLRRHCPYPDKTEA